MAMRTVNESGILGNDTFEQRLMPKVLIDKVVIENNSIPPILPSDPHITTNPTNSINTSSDTGCHVTVDLIINDIVESDALSSWFYDAEVLKYMHLNIVQSGNPELTRRLVLGDMTVLEEISGRSDITIRTISLQSYYSDLEQFYQTDNTGRNRVADIPFRTSYDLPVVNPQHLAYFAFCFLNIEELATDFNLDMYGYSARQGILSEDITSEIVIDNGEIVSESYVFLLPDGEIWTGAVHEHNGAFMAGREHTNTPHPILTREVVVNSKVQDFRDIDSPLESEINLKPVESLLSTILNRNTSNEINIEETTAYFSDAFMSSDSKEGKRVCNMTFSFDFSKFCMNNSRFGKLFADPRKIDIQQEILRLSRITSFKVFRHRTDKGAGFNKVGTKSLGSNFKENAYFSSEQVPALIVRSDDSGGVLRPVTNDAGSIREIDLFGAETLRSYAVTDTEVADLTDGRYRYSVELKAVDGSFEYLRNIFNSFVDVKEKFALYNNLSTSPDYYDSKTNVFKNGLKVHYDILQQNTNGTVDQSMYPWTQGPANFCETLKVLTNLSDAELFAIFVKLYSVCNASTGTPNGVRSVLTVMEKLETILTKIIGDNRQTSVNNSEKSGQSVIANRLFMEDDQTFSSIFEAEEPHSYGINVLDLNDRNGFSGPTTITAIDYFSRVQRENSKYFIGAQPILPSPGQTQYTPSEAFGDLVTYGATYLTPSVITNGDAVLSTNKQNTSLTTNPQKYTNFSIPIIRRFLQDGEEVNGTDDYLNKENLLADYGVSIGPITEDEIETLKDSAVNFLGNNSNFNSQNITYDQLVKAVNKDSTDELSSYFSSDVTLMNNEGQSSPLEQTPISCYDLTQDPCNVLEKFVKKSPFGIPLANGAYDEELVRQIPNQIKSLFLSNLSNLVKVNWLSQNFDVAKSYETALMFIWNYQVISKVEYLRGYSFSEKAGIQVSYPIWEPLKFSTLQNIINQETTVLCKIVPYTDLTFNIGQSIFNKMPDYNNYFYISSNNEIATTIKRQTIQIPRNAIAQQFIGRVTKVDEEVPRSAYMTTVPLQKVPQNASADPTAPTNTLKANRKVTNRIISLAEDLEDDCSSAIPDDRRNIPNPNGSTPAPVPNNGTPSDPSAPPSSGLVPPATPTVPSQSPRRPPIASYEMKPPEQDKEEDSFIPDSDEPTAYIIPELPPPMVFDLGDYVVGEDGTLTPVVAYSPDAEAEYDYSGEAPIAIEDLIGSIVAEYKKPLSTSAATEDAVKPEENEYEEDIKLIEEFVAAVYDIPGTQNGYKPPETPTNNTTSNSNSASAGLSSSTGVGLATPSRTGGSSTTSGGGY
jgi:hypothetical protein